MESSQGVDKSTGERSTPSGLRGESARAQHEERLHSKESVSVNPGHTLIPASFNSSDKDLRETALPSLTGFSECWAE